MNDNFLRYYNNELEYVRKSAIGFSQKYPKIAGNLHHDRHQPDPMVDRLVESFAFLTAKIQQQLDGDYTLLLQSILNILYPQLLLPTPSFATIQFIPQDNIAVKQLINKGAELVMQADEHTCPFQTCYPVEIWPLFISQVNYYRSMDTYGYHKKVQAHIKLRLTASNNQYHLKTDAPNTLRFFIKTSKQYANKLYEYLLNHTRTLILKSIQSQKIVILENNTPNAVGFSLAEQLLPQFKQTSNELMLLSEYCFFQDKFMYFDITDLSDAIKSLQENEIDIIFLMDKYQHDLVSAIRDKTFLLGCTPVVNLFLHKSHPLRVDHKHDLYSINVNDDSSQSQKEIYLIDKLTGVDEAGDRLYFKSLYGEKYKDTLPNFINWEAVRKPAWNWSKRYYEGEDVALRFTTVTATLNEPAWIVEGDIWCMNRDVPNGVTAPFKLKNISNDQFIIRCLCEPTPVVRPDTNIHYLQSTMAVSYMSLTHPQTCHESICSLILVANTAQSQEVNFIIDNISAVDPTPCCMRYPHSNELTYVHGVNINIEFAVDRDDECELFLFGSVLSQHLNAYCPLNSFISLTFTNKHKGEIAKWNPQFNRQVSTV